jgi:hypothetical protein
MRKQKHGGSPTLLERRLIEMEGKELKPEVLRMKCNAFHRLGEAFQQLVNFCHLYADYLSRLAEIEELRLKGKEEARER